MIPTPTPIPWPTPTPLPLPSGTQSIQLPDAGGMLVDMAERGVGFYQAYLAGSGMDTLMTLLILILLMTAFVVILKRVQRL